MTLDIIVFLYVSCYFQGAPEAILDYCDTILIGNEEVTMNEHWRAQVQDYIRAFGEMGERVVGNVRLLLC